MKNVNFRERTFRMLPPIKCPDPLIDVGTLYAVGNEPTCDEAVIQEIKQTFRDLIFGIISFQEAKSVLQRLIGSTQSVEKVWEIIHVSDTPLPEAENFQQPPGKKTKTWSDLEDMRLIHAITKRGLQDWTYISKFVGNSRTRAQCSQRWHRTLNPVISKESWNTEDDQKLMELVQIYGTHTWTKVSASLKNRTDVQCRYRWQLLTKKELGCEQKTAKENTNPIVKKSNLLPLPIPQFDEALFSQESNGTSPDLTESDTSQGKEENQGEQNQIMEWNQIFSYQAAMFEAFQLPDIGQITLM